MEIETPPPAPPAPPSTPLPYVATVIPFTEATKEIQSVRLRKEREDACSRAIANVLEQFKCALIPEFTMMGSQPPILRFRLFAHD